MGVEEYVLLLIRNKTELGKKKNSKNKPLMCAHVLLTCLQKIVLFVGGTPVNHHVMYSRIIGNVTSYSPEARRW